jgi:hypothetical protein
MRREATLLLSSLALVACGARTGLGGELVESDAQADAVGDALTEADAPPDAPIPPGFCPIAEPMTNGTCPPATPSGTLCIYVTPPHRVDWCCVAGGWVDCTTISSATESCGQVQCTPGTRAECIESEPQECCFCDSVAGTVSRCSSC